MEKISIQLEEMLSDISFTGFKNISADMYENLLNLSKRMSEAGFETGSKMLKQLCDEIKALKHNEKNGEKASELISSLECYLKNISNSD